MGTGEWAVTTTFESVLTWNYEVAHQGLRELYEKATREQWNVSVDVDWSPALDPESEILLDHQNPLEAWETIGLPVEACIAATREGASRARRQR